MRSSPEAHDHSAFFYKAMYDAKIRPKPSGSAKVSHCRVQTRVTCTLPPVLSQERSVRESKGHPDLQQQGTAFDSDYVVHGRHSKTALNNNYDDKCIKTNDISEVVNMFKIVKALEQ